METNENKDFDCCPQFDPIPWDGKTFEWNNKRFIRDKVFTFFYMPVNFGKVMRRIDKLVRASSSVDPSWVCLSEHTSKWNMDVFLAVQDEVKGGENILMNGKYFSKVYEGPYKDTGKWTSDFQNIIKKEGYKPKKWFMWYTTCPKCAKKFGKNYVVIIAEVE